MTQQNAALLLLDRSGSMTSCRDLTIGGVNDFIGKLHGDASGKGASFELITFDSLGFDTIRKGTIEDIADLNKREFEPRALTPLHDSVAHAVDRLRDTPGKRKMLIIVTDGLENASKKFPKTEQIKALIEKVQAEGWLVIYLAAHVDAWSQAAAIGVPNERAMNFKAAPAEVRRDGIIGRMFGGKASVNPLTIALGAAAGLGLAMYGGKALAALGFTDKDRNASMGVDGVGKTWQDAVKEDVDSFDEPVNGIFDLPQDVADMHADLPADFDPALGTMDASGNQPGAPDGDILDHGDATSHADSNYDIDSDAEQDRDDGNIDRPDPPSYDRDPPSRSDDSDNSRSSWSGGSGSRSDDSWSSGSSSGSNSSSSWGGSSDSSSSDSGSSSGGD